MLSYSHDFVLFWSYVLVCLCDRFALLLLQIQTGPGQDPRPHYTDAQISNYADEQKRDPQGTLCQRRGFHILDHGPVETNVPRIQYPLDVGSRQAHTQSSLTHDVGSHNPRRSAHFDSYALRGLFLYASRWVCHSSAYDSYDGVILCI